MNVTRTQTDVSSVGRFRNSCKYLAMFLLFTVPCRRVLSPSPGEEKLYYLPSPPVLPLRPKCTVDTPRRRRLLFYSAPAFLDFIFLMAFGSLSFSPPDLRKTWTHIIQALLSFSCQHGLDVYFYHSYSPFLELRQPPCRFAYPPTSQVLNIHR